MQSNPSASAGVGAGDNLRLASILPAAAVIIAGARTFRFFPVSDPGTRALPRIEVARG